MLSDMVFACVPVVNILPRGLISAEIWLSDTFNPALLLRSEEFKVKLMTPRCHVAGCETSPNNYNSITVLNGYEVWISVSNMQCLVFAQFVVGV